MIPSTGLVFGDPLPCSLPTDGMGFVDEKDIVQYMQSYTIFNLDFDTSELLLMEEFETQFPSEDNLPAVELFFV